MIMMTLMTLMAAMTALYKHKASKPIGPDVLRGPGGRGQRPSKFSAMTFLVFSHYIACFMAFPMENTSHCIVLPFLHPVLASAAAALSEHLGCFWPRPLFNGETATIRHGDPQGGILFGLFYILLPISPSLSEPPLSHPPQAFYLPPHPSPFKSCKI